MATVRDRRPRASASPLPSADRVYPPRCNGRKRDFLADVPFLARWVERNTTRGAEIEARFDHLHLPFDRHVSQQVTEWSYAQVERSGGQVWSGGADYAKLAAGWQSVLSAERQPSARG